MAGFVTVHAHEDTNDRFQELFDYQNIAGEADLAAPLAEKTRMRIKMFLKRWQNKSPLSILHLVIFHQYQRKN